MTHWPTEGKLLLTFLWAIPLSDTESAAIFERGVASGLLEPLTGEAGDEWLHAEDFLLVGGGSRPKRHLFTGAPLSVGVGAESLPLRMIVTWHAGYHALTVLVAVTVAGRSGQVAAEDVDLAIAVIQSLERRPTADPGSGVHGRIRGEVLPSVFDAVTAAFGELVADIAPGTPLDRRSWCVELRADHGYPAARTVSGDPRPFYGLATGDEGWRFVPVDLAAERLGEPWGTRSFVAVYPMATGTVCVNAKGADYVAHQHEFTRRHFGREEPYFALDTEIAGLDHGTLFALERVVVRLALADRWLRTAWPEPEELKPGKAVARTRLLRGSLDDILQLLNSLLRPEVDSLERRLVTSMGVDRTIAQLDRQAQAIDEETRYSYES